MRKLSIALSLVAAFGLAVVACGDDDDKNACEKAADVMMDGMDGYCDGKADQCWACDCHNQDLVATPTGSGTDMTWECAEPDPVDTTCDGTDLESAQECLDDKAACEQSAADSMETFCNATTK